MAYSSTNISIKSCSSSNKNRIIMFKKKSDPQTLAENN